MFSFSIVFGKLLAGGPLVTPYEEIWTEFLESPEFKFLQSLVYSEKKGDDLPCDSDKELEMWLAALDEACCIWKTAMHDKHSIGDDAKEIIYVEDEEELWNAICFLIKGAFYQSNDIPLDALAKETSDQFLLHAAAGVLPLCRKIGVDSTKLRIVWEKILHLHGDQMAQEGPVLRRCPLHIVAASKCARSDFETFELPSLVEPMTDDRGLHTQVLSDILAKTPASIASAPDSEGNCPFHLACASGYAWEGGLKVLFRAAPEVATSGRHFVLMASTKPTKKASSCGKWLRSKLCNKKRAHHRLNQKETTHRNELEDLSTVFQLVRADPNTALALFSG